MDKYDDLFAPAVDESVFADKGALDPLAEPEDIAARDDQEAELAGILRGVHEGYLPPTVSVYGPPGTGKTLTVRRMCREFADRHEEVAVEYVNLKECRSLFSVANEIHLELAGEKVGAYRGLDGAFEGIWSALEAYPEWPLIILDEIDHIQHDANYAPSDFFYRLLRGEGKLERGLNLSVVLISNELLEVDLRLDSRVRSAMSGEAVFFPPYDASALMEIVSPRLERAFEPGRLSEEAIERGVREAADRWGDARKTVQLFRQAGELANQRQREQVTIDCIEESFQETERTSTIAKLHSLPLRHLAVLTASVSTRRRSSREIVQPVPIRNIHDRLQGPEVDDRFRIGQRSIHTILDDLETMGLVDTWAESGGRAGRARYVETTFDPEWVHAAQTAVAEQLRET